MVDLLAASIPENQRQDGELEIDLDSLSVPTLKKLDQYVTECIKKKVGVSDKSVENSGGGKSDSSSSSDSDSSSDSSDSGSEKISGGKENEAST